MLLLHSQETNLSQIQNKFLRSSPKLTVRHLCKFLATKLGGHNYQNFRLRITEQSEPLDQDVSLERAEEVTTKFFREIYICDLNFFFF